MGSMEAGGFAVTNVVVAVENDVETAVVENDAVAADVVNFVVAVAVVWQLHPKDLEYETYGDSVGTWTSSCRPRRRLQRR